MPEAEANSLEARVRGLEERIKKLEKRMTTLGELAPRWPFRQRDGLTATQERTRLGPLKTEMLKAYFPETKDLPAKDTKRANAFFERARGFHRPEKRADGSQPRGWMVERWVLERWGIP